MTGDLSNAERENGVRTLRSSDSFDETAAKIAGALASHGVKIFATIDQQAEARAVGLKMRPVTLILFGNPKAGTPVMVAEPTAALDLPLKAVIWEAANGAVHVSFNTTGYLMARHHLPETLAANLLPAEKLIESLLS